jgi:hypothetical protein
LTLLHTATLVLLHGLVTSEASAPAAVSAPEQRHFLAPSRLFLPWAEQPTRWFSALEFDAGFLYLRPRFELGYGQPHASWWGLDLNPIFSDEGVGSYMGLRVAQHYWHLRAGGRYWFTFHRSFLQPRESYSVEDIEREAGPASRFLTWEAELGLNLPLAGGTLLTEVAGSYVTGVADGYYVYEETLRVVADPPWVWRSRVGYLWGLAAGALQLGPVLELLGLPGRDALVLRAGGLVRIRLAADLEARGTFLPAVATPDALGAKGGDAFLVGIRYRWASGP